ncbi:MAG: hypothetical protein J7K82_02760 [Thermoproteales archaeon]|nr:hypothetical protein [Thermoproteales archaeon]
MYRKIKNAIKILDEVIVDDSISEEGRKNVLTAKKILIEALDDILYLRGYIREMSYVFEETISVLGMKENNGKEDIIERLKRSLYTQVDYKVQNGEEVVKVENIIG